MRWLVGLFLATVALAIAVTFTRDVTSRTMRSLDGVVTAYYAQSGNESRTLPIPGDVDVRLPDGRNLRLSLASAVEVKPGTHVKVLEMVAPWGTVWYRLADES